MFFLVQGLKFNGRFNKWPTVQGSRYTVQGKIKNTVHRAPYAVRRNSFPVRRKKRFPDAWRLKPDA